MLNEIEMFTTALNKGLDTEFTIDTVRRFTEGTNSEPGLKEFRDFVEKHVYGFGERCFIHMWKLILSTLDESPEMLEIGVYKGQIIALWRLLKPDANIWGITPLSSYAGINTPPHPDENYLGHIRDLHNKFSLKLDESRICHGFSTDKKWHDMFSKDGTKFDVVYIDGCHEKWAVVSDLELYAPMVKPGGYLVMDDAANNKPIPWGMFPGKQDVSDAVDEWYTGNKDKFTEVLMVMHNRVFRNDTV